MHKEIPNDSILLPEGVVEDDAKAVWLSRTFSDLVTGKLLEEEKRKEEENETAQ